MVLIHRASWLAALCVVAAGCASAADGTGTTTDEPTGEIAAAIERVPDDVQCVVLTVSVYYPNYSYRWVVQNVTPGDSSVIRVGALTAGYGNVSGQAYSTPCQFYFDASYPPASEFQTWISDFQSFYVQSGRITPVQLNFHQLGGVDIGVNFDNCSCDQFGNCTIVDDAGNVTSCQPPGFPSPDGGPVDAGVPTFDASGPIP